MKKTIVGLGFFLATFLLVVIFPTNTSITKSVANILLSPTTSTSVELIANSSVGVINSWGGASVTSFPETVNSHSGLISQKVLVTSLPTNSGVIWKRDFNLIKGHLYEMSIWLRSTNAVKVQAFIRKDKAHYQLFSSQTLKVGNAWQKVTIKGGVGKDSGPNVTASQFVNSQVGISFKSTGTLWIDEISLKDVTDINSVPIDSQAVPTSFFGMHINKWGTYQPWPAITEFGLLRLWDTGTMWRNIQPTKGSWDWSRTDYYVNSAIAANPSVSILYTLGQTPQWAAARPNETAEYGPGASSEPANMATWRDYVRNIAIRYKGKIKYWEIWNETNGSEFYKGSVTKMVEMSRIASEELKKIDSTNIVLSPNITITGLAWLDEFLFQGGGQYVDAISFHHYFDVVTAEPEYIYPEIEALRSLLKSYSLSNKPLWNTEGSLLATDTPVTNQQIQALVSRTLLVQLALGIKNFSWYAWDIRQKNGVNLSTSTYNNLSEGGIVYREMIRWLKGSRLTAKSVNGDIWLLQIERENGYVGHIIWKTKGTTMYSIPESWQIVNQRTVEGGIYSIRAIKNIQLGEIPVLLENR